MTHRHRKKPLVGLTTVHTNVPRPVILANQAYVDLLADFGAIPVLLTQDTDVIEHLDALVLIGGQDIDPELYGQKQEVSYRGSPEFSKRYHRTPDYAPDRWRDDFEMALYQAAKARKIPILGICRGLQLINVAEGGTLYQELPEPIRVWHESGPEGSSFGHFIRIDLQSKLYRLMQTEHYASSSSHHQCIDKLGKNLRASAWSEDDLIEAIEWHNDEQWLMAVQGHIEQSRLNYPLFNRLVEDFVHQSSRV